MSAFILSEITQRERKESQELSRKKMITSGKIVPYKWRLPSSNISVKKDFDTEVLLR